MTKPITLTWISFLTLLLLGCKPSITDTTTKIADKPLDSISIDKLKNKADTIKDVANKAMSAEHFADALKGYSEELELRKQVPDGASMLMFCYGNIGLCKHNLYLYNDAIDYYNEALLIDPNDSWTLGAMGKSYLELGDYDKSIKQLNRAISIAQVDNNLADVLEFKKTLSNVYREKKDYANALLVAKEGSSLSIDNKDKLAFSINLGNVLLESKQYVEAQKYYISAIQLAKTDSSNVLILAKALTNLGTTFKHLKDYTKALDYIKQGLAYKRNVIGIAASYNNMADVFLRQSNIDTALTYYQKAISTILPFEYSTWRDNPQRADISKAKSKTDLMGYLRDKANALKKVDQKLSIETFKLADIVCDSIRLNSTETNSKFFWREEAYPIYSAAVKLCFQLGEKKLAYDFFEKSRAIMLLDELGIRQAQSQSEVQNTTLITLENLQDKLDSHHAIVEYFMPDNCDVALKDSVFVLIIDKNNLDIKRLYCPQDSLNDFVQNYQGAREDRGGQQANMYHRWYRLLVKPLGLNTQVSNLSISANGLLSRVVFESLLKAPEFKKENFLLYDYTISYAYSATLKYYKVTNTQATANNMLVIAPVNFSKFHLPDLTNNTSENLSQFNKDSKDQLLLGKDANKNSFLSAASQYKYLQFFTHATALDSTVYEPAIYFNDSILSLSEIYKHRFNADLVALTACQTNLGDEKTGEGINSLARGFIYAGVPSTLGTMWKIPEVSGFNITHSFYTNLNKGMDKDEAIRLAKLDFLDQEFEKVNPYFWSSLVLVGNTDAVSASRYPSTLWWILGGIGIIAMGCLFYMRKQ